MTKFLVISDIHLDAPSDPNSNDLFLFDKTAEWFAGLIREHQPHFVINCGDTNHRDGGMSVGTIRLFRRFFDTIASAVDDVDAKLLTIPGNHDQHNVDGMSHVMEPLKWLMNSEVVEKSKSFIHEGTKFVMAPYRRDLEEFRTSIIYPDKSEHPDQRYFDWPDIFFTHMDVKDCVMNSGMKATKGVDASYFNGNTRVFNGHYHLPQELGKITVIGAPQYRTFRDIDPPGTPRRGVLMITARPKLDLIVHRFTNPWTNVFNTFKGETKEDLELQASLWCRSLFKDYGKDLSDDRIHIRFVAPSSELTKLKADPKWDKFRVVQFLPNDKLVQEEQTISLDLKPSLAVKQYFEETQCTCGVKHDVEIGQKAIRDAEAQASSAIARRKVQFQQIHIKNFRSIGEATVDLSSAGLTLIEGVNKDEPTADSNGAGKSSIAEALLWCLFDSTSKSISKDRIIRHGADKAEVEVTFTADGTEYVITRGRSKAKPSLQIERVSRENDAAEGKRLNLEDITPHDARKATEKVIDIVGVNMEQFLLTTVLSQGFGTKFSSMNDSSRKELLESFLGLEVYDLAGKIIQQKVKDVEAKQKVLVDETLGLESAKATTAAHLKTLIASRDDAANRSASEVENLKSEIAEYERVIPEWEAALEDKQVEIAAITSTMTAIDAELNAVSAKIHELTTQKRLAEADEKRRRDELRALEAEPNTSCATCSQVLPSSTIERLYQQRKERMESLTQFLETISETIATTTVQAAKLTVEDKSRLEKAKKNAKTHYDLLMAELSDWKSIYAEQKSNRAATLKELGKLLVDQNQFGPLIAEAEASIVRTEVSLAVLVAQSESLDRERHQLDFWSKAFHPTGIRSVLLRSVVNYLNEHLRNLSTVLTGGGFGVSVSSTTELKSKKEAVNKLDISITPDRQYEELSGGEQRKVDLALNMAVAKLAQQTCGFSCNLLVADEVLDSLDITASKAVLDMFGAMADQGMSVFLISHSQSIKSLIPRYITVVKKGGVSEILSA